MSKFIKKPHLTLSIFSPTEVAASSTQRTVLLEPEKLNDASPLPEQRTSHRRSSSKAFLQENIFEIIHDVKIYLALIPKIQN